MNEGRKEGIIGLVGRWMDGWMDGLWDGWMDGGMDGQTNQFKLALYCSLYLRSLFHIPALTHIILVLIRSHARGKLAESPFWKACCE